MSSTQDKKLVNLTAPYANDGKKNAERVNEKVKDQPSSAAAATVVKLAGSDIKVLDAGEKAEHRKFGNGKDVSDELAVAAPKRDKDLHPSKTYQGAGDEVDEAEWG